MSTARRAIRPTPGAWGRRWALALAGLALIAASCSSSDPTPAADPAVSVETTTTAPAATTESTTTSAATPSTADDAAAEPAVLTLDAYLVAVINADADVGTCGQKAEEDFNDANPANDEATEAEAVEGGKEYFRGQQACQQGAVAAIAALQPPPEAAAAHADVVAARQAWQAAARAELDEAETIDEIIRAFVEPGPAVVEAAIAWGQACRALEDVATSNGIDANLECPEPPPTK